MPTRITRIAAGALAGGAVIALTLVGAAPAFAGTPQQTVRWTKIGIYPHTGPSFSTPRAGAAVPDGTVVTDLCEVSGDPVTSDVVANDTIWAKTNIGFLPNAFLDSGYDGWTPGVPNCNAPAPAPVAPAPAPAPAAPAPAAPVAPQAPAASAPSTRGSTGSGGSAAAPAGPSTPGPSTPAPPPHLTAAGSWGIQWTDAQIASTPRYDRAAAARWALKHFSSWKGAYDFGDNNCTYFTSTMFKDVAGWPTTGDWSDSTFFVNAASFWSPFGPTKDFVSADYFKNWIKDNRYGTVTDVTGDATLPGTAQVGDLVQYDYHHSDAAQTPGADGTVDHTMVIVGFRDGTALVVGVSDPPKSPNDWRNGSQTTPLLSRVKNARLYLVHITR